MRTRINALLVPAVVLAGLTCLPATLLAETATLYRDTWGVPNIYADSEEAACFAMGYAQAEDRPRRLFDNYRLALGRLAEVAGPRKLTSDLRARIARHTEISRRGYATLSAKVRACMEAYQAGIERYFKEHPRRLPDNALKLEPWMVIALGRATIHPWVHGQAYQELARARIELEPLDYHGSNEMALSPSRTKQNVPIAVIDPHEPLYGPTRWYEVRMYGGQIQVAGVAVVGTPVIALGHNAYISMAHTTGGPDVADIFIETLNPQNPRQYKYDGQWRDGTLETIKIAVKTASGKIDHVTREVLYTHHGPVVAKKGDRGYVIATPYADQVALGDMVYKIWCAKNIKDAKAALAMAQYHPQNVMITCVDGDIYYQRTGRVPIRPDGYDYTKPVPGHTSKTEWKGLHATDDLVQILNPKCGWMQNCNISPRVMFRDSPLTEDKYKPYLYMEPKAFGISYGLHQRAASAYHLLDKVKQATIEDVFEIATSPEVYGVKPWQNRLKTAWAKAPAATKRKKDLRAFANAILTWNGRAEKDSTGILCYHFWKQEQSHAIRMRAKLGAPPPPSLTDRQVIKTLEAGRRRMLRRCRKIDAKYGDIYRFGRKGGTRTAPASGGSVPAVETARAMYFSHLTQDGKYIPTVGQSALQVVLMTRPPQSWTAAPLGQSDDPDSPHFDDQAIKLLSDRKLKSTYFLDRAALLKNLESKKVLAYGG